MMGDFMAKKKRREEKKCFLFLKMVLPDVA